MRNRLAVVQGGVGRACLRRVGGEGEVQVGLGLSPAVALGDLRREGALEEIACSVRVARGGVRETQGRVGYGRPDLDAGVV